MASTGHHGIDELEFFLVGTLLEFLQVIAPGKVGDVLAAVGTIRIHHLDEATEVVDLFANLGPRLSGEILIHAGGYSEEYYRKRENSEKHGETGKTTFPFMGIFHRFHLTPSNIQH